jgi:fibronectin type III domain protein
VTDYRKDTGSSGEMVIRDNGSTITFLISAHSGSTFSHDMPWGYTINGVTNNNRQSDYGQGAGWLTLGTWTVSTDQTVTFRLFDTGTSGLGGPTTLSAFINRAGPPLAPSKPVLSEVTATSVRAKWTAGSNNGAAIDLYQVGYNTVGVVTGGTIVNTDTDNVFTGLTPGTTYYWWARTHNAKGYSPWSAAGVATTIATTEAPDQVITSDATQTTFVASFTDNGDGGSPILERQLAYNTTNVTTGATTVSYTGVTVVTGLTPATTYYVWARVRNSAGWGPYSAVATIRTIAGAWMNVNNVWKEAIPYVRDGGVWKIARPYLHDAGIWKQSQ